MEPNIITGMITSKKYLKAIEPIYVSEYFESRGAKLISKWCMQYYKKYNKAPKKNMKAIFESKKRKTRMDEDTSEFISKCLSKLSKNFDREKSINIEYLTDRTKDYFKTRSLQLHTDKITACLANDDITTAEQLVSNYTEVQLPDSEGIHPLANPDLIKQAFAERQSPIFTFPGALGKMINSEFVPDSLVMFQAGGKVGKTFFLTECFIRAGMQRENSVAFFGAGDMSETQMIRRICMRVAGKSDMEEYCGTLYYPVLDCMNNQLDTCTKKERVCDFGCLSEKEEADLETMEYKDYVECAKEPMNKRYRPCTACKGNYCFKPTAWYIKRKRVKPLSSKKAIKVAEKFMPLLPNIKLHSSPTRSLSVKNIDSVLDIWEHTEGFMPKTIIIDYADILCPDSSDKELRHKISGIWLALRSLALKRKLLIITATQADAGIMNKHSQDLTNFSESKDKYDHVTAGFAINSTEKEKRLMKIRIGNLIRRENESDMDRQVTILRCLQMGRPYLDSHF